MEHIKSFKLFEEISYEPSLEEELSKLNINKRQIRIREILFDHLPLPVHKDMCDILGLRYGQPTDKTINLVISRFNRDHDYINIELYISSIRKIINYIIKSFDGEYTKYKIFNGGYCYDITDKFNKLNSNKLLLPRFMRNNTSWEKLYGVYIIFYN